MIGYFFCIYRGTIVEELERNRLSDAKNEYAKALLASVMPFNRR
ncbi:hypothetical protein [Paenibacillus taichungensis]